MGDDERELQALVEWQCLVDDRLDAFFDNFAAMQTPLAAKVQRCNREWATLSNTARTDIIMDITDALAAAFAVETPRYFTKSSWARHMAEYGYVGEYADYFKNRDDFAFYICDTEHLNPCITMNWTENYMGLKELTGVVDTVAHEFGHYLHDLYVRKYNTSENRKPILSEGMCSEEALGRLETFLPHSVEYFIAEAEENPRKKYEEIWDDPSSGDFETAVANLDYLKIFGESVAENFASAFTNRLRASLILMDDMDGKSQIAKLPLLFAEHKAAMDESARQFGFELPGHDLVPAYISKRDFLKDADRVIKLCESLSDEFTDRFKACDPASMTAFDDNQISKLFKPAGKISALAFYMAMLARKLRSN